MEIVTFELAGLTKNRFF